MTIRKSSWYYRLYVLAYVNDRGWIDQPYFAEDYERFRETPIGRLHHALQRCIFTEGELRGHIHLTWQMAETELHDWYMKCQQERGKLVRAKLESGQMSLCPFFWKTVAALFIYLILGGVLNAIFRTLKAVFLTAPSWCSTRISNGLRTVFRPFASFFASAARVLCLTASIAALGAIIMVAIWELQPPIPTACNRAFQNPRLIYYCGEECRLNGTDFNNFSYLASEYEYEPANHYDALLVARVDRISWLEDMARRAASERLSNEQNLAREAAYQRVKEQAREARRLRLQPIHEKIIQHERIIDRASDMRSMANRLYSDSVINTAALLNYRNTATDIAMIAMALEILLAALLFSRSAYRTGGGFRTKLQRIGEAIRDTWHLFVGFAKAKKRRLCPLLEVVER